MTTTLSSLAGKSAEGDRNSRISGAVCQPGAADRARLGHWWFTGNTEPGRQR